MAVETITDQRPAAVDECHMGNLTIALICRYLPSDSKMGVGYQVHHLANALVRAGHSVTCFSLSPRPDDAEYIVRKIPVLAPLRSMRMSLYLRSIDWSAFDILHAHGDDWFLWGRNIPPHLRTVHGSCLSEAWNIPSLWGKVYMLWLAALETLSVVVADRTVGVSQNTCRSYPWIRQMIPNGVSLSLFYPGKVKENRPTILFVGTYKNRKRGKLLMQIFEDEIRRAIPDAQLWMVCSDAPSANGVAVLGRLTAEELADRYRRAWVFCLPSTYEGFGIPYIEAMASGTSVVSSPNVGANEVLDGGQYGLIAEDSRLSAALKCLLTDPDERHRLEGAGLRRALEFSLDSVLRAYEALYLEVIGHQSRRPN